jgi:nicotinamide mononucleotide transporter
LQQIVQQFLNDIHQSSWLEFIAVITGIASVVYSRRENILVYPVGMISTGIFIYLYVKHGLYADASVNFYFTVMSIIGWYMWSEKNPANRQPLTPQKAALKITRSTNKEWTSAVLFFCACWLVLYVVLKSFTDSTVPIADSFTSGAAFTGMWLMNKKKLENWIWWIITDLASVPLNFYKHLVFASFQYLVFLILAIMGYITWRKKALYGDA